MVTARDVAQRAGVSAMTVSNVINGRDGKVSEATVARVRAAIEELGYIPNAQARSLAGAESRVLALVYQAVPQRAALAAPYESLFVGACEKAARAGGYVLMLCGTSDAQEMVSQLRAWRVDGAIVMATTRIRPVDFMERAGVPSVFIDVYGDGLAGSSVNIDDRQGARLAPLCALRRSQSQWLRRGEREVGGIPSRFRPRRWCGWYGPFRDGGCDLRGWCRRWGQAGQPIA